MIIIVCTIHCNDFGKYFEFKFRIWRKEQNEPFVVNVENDFWTVLWSGHFL